MSTMTVSLDLPRDLVGALDVPEIGVGSRLKELIAVELFREGVISSGKGAELTGTSKGEFIDLLGHRGISYFTQSSEELIGEVATLTPLLEKLRSGGFRMSKDLFRTGQQLAGEAS